MDMYRDWSVEALHEHRVAILTELERREKLDALPGQVTQMARDAVAAGVDPETLRAAMDDALTPAAEAPTT